LPNEKTIRSHNNAHVRTVQTANVTVLLLACLVTPIIYLDAYGLPFISFTVQDQRENGVSFDDYKGETLRDCLFSFFLPNVITLNKSMGIKMIIIMVIL